MSYGPALMPGGAPHFRHAAPADATTRATLAVVRQSERLWASHCMLMSYHVLTLRIGEYLRRSIIHVRSKRRCAPAYIALHPGPGSIVSTKGVSQTPLRLVRKKLLGAAGVRVTACLASVVGID